jgi:predicted XRE-type DNA-binding protein
VRQSPAREQLKAHLTLQIYRIIKSRGLTQAEAGAILGIKQPQVSALMRNRSGNLSVERPMDFLIAPGQAIEITVRPTRKDHDGLFPSFYRSRLPRSLIQAAPVSSRAERMALPWGWEMLAA